MLADWSYLDFDFDNEEVKRKMANNLIFADGGTPSAGSGGLSSILKNIQLSIGHWGYWIIAIVGLVMLIYGGVQLFKAVKAMGGQGGGQSGMTWVKAGLAIVIGIMMLSGGFNSLAENKQLGSGAADNILQGNG